MGSSPEYDIVGFLLGDLANFGHFCVTTTGRRDVENTEK